MPPVPASPDRVDLLVIGALTIDRLTDGTTAPGGSVLYAARAAAANGYAVGVETVAGPEPEAATALRELQRLGTLQVQREDHTLRFGHAEAGERRELTLERPSPRLAPVSRTRDAAAVLFAPVADEFRAEIAGQPLGGAYRGAILQGWLRSLAPGHRVEPLPLSALDDALADVLTGFGVLFASTEDLRAVAASPAAQLDALRACFGSTPRLAVTGGSTGSWLDDEDGRVRVLPRVKITSHRTVGAGDAFAALTIAELARGTTLRVAAERATDAVVDLLEVRST